MQCSACNVETMNSLFCYVCDNYLPRPDCGTKAGIARRWFAHIVDLLFYGSLLAAALVLLVFSRTSGLPVESVAISILISAFAYVILSSWWLSRGKTVGKWLLGLRVLDKRNGELPGLGRMLVRETIGKWVSTAFLGLGYFWAIWDRDAQAWHDKISGTVVLFQSGEQSEDYEIADGSQFAFLAAGIVATLLVAAAIYFYWPRQGLTHDLHLPTQEASSHTVHPSFAGNFNAQNTFTALFSNYDPATKTSSISVNSESGVEPATVRPILVIPFSDGGPSKFLLVTSATAADEDCHACGARIGAYVFADRSGMWVADTADKEVMQFGAYGSPGEAKLIRFASNVYGFSLTIDDMAQGEHGVIEQFVAPVNGHFQPVLSLTREEDNSGACGPPDYPACYSNTSTVHFLSRGGNGVFDVIEAEQAGTRATDQNLVVPANQKHLYVFNGEKYAEIGAQPGTATTSKSF